MCALILKGIVLEGLFKDGKIVKGVISKDPEFHYNGEIKDN